MRYLILSDIHSNVEAFEACIRRAKQASYDTVLCCGDIVGYGPNPVEAIDLVRDLNTTCIRGNHDRVASGLDEATNFNMHARQAIYWTRDALPDAYRDYLASLPLGPLDITAESQLVHGAITHEDDYIFTEAEANMNLLLTRKNITFFGHSHFPVVFTANKSDKAVLAPMYEFDEFTAAECDPHVKVFVNPGSVGQPRDGDPRAAFAIWDYERARVEFYRVEYDVEKTQSKMRDALLPTYLIDRLSRGR
jgi:predicted phosphodiesterase